MKTSTPIPNRVVVIDDEPLQARPLLEILHRNGISAAYYSGVRKALPLKPTDGVRLVFLDLVLVKSRNPKTIRSAIAANLKRIISEENGPYLLLTWSSHDDPYLTHLRELFNDGLKNISPITILPLDKTVYMTIPPGGGVPQVIPKAFNTIVGEIEKHLKATGVFQLFWIWEHIVHEAAKRVVRDISKSHPIDASWSENISGVFLSLAEANAGKQLDKTNPTEVAQNSLTTFNSVFGDTLARGLGKHDFSHMGKIDFKENATAKVKAELNRKLLIAEKNSSVRPGDVRLLRRSQAAKIANSSFVWDALDNEYVKKSYAATKGITIRELTDDVGKVKPDYKTEFKKYSDELRDGIKKSAKYVQLEVSPIWGPLRKREKSYAKPPDPNVALQLCSPNVDIGYTLTPRQGSCPYSVRLECKPSFIDTICQNL